MANSNAGSITWNLDLNTTDFDSKLAASKSGAQGLTQNFKDTEKPITNVFSAIGSSFHAVMAGMQAAVQTTSIIIGTVLAASLGGAISRVDTLNNANRVFQDMGFSADQVTKSTDALKQSILGLPTALNEGITNVELLAASTGNLSTAQQLFSAMNDAVLGFGGTTNDVHSAVLQLSQDLTRGTISAATFDSLLNAQMGPVLNAVAKQMGMTSSALKDGLSAGTVSVAAFEAALIGLDQNGGGGLVSLHQIALQSTEGIATSFANARTAMVRGMADIIQAIGAPAIAKSITDIGSAIEGIEKHIAGIITSFKASGTTVQQFAAVALPALGLLSGAVSPLLQTLPVIGPLFEKLTGPIGLVIGLVAGLIASSPALRAALGTAFQILGSTLQTLAPAISQISGIFTQFAGTLGSALAPVIVALAGAFSQILLAVVPLIPPLLQLAVQIIQQILLPVLPALVQIIQVLAGAFAIIVSALLPLLPPITHLAIVILQQILLPLLPSIVRLITMLADVFTQVLTALLPLLPPIIGLATLLISQLAPILPLLINLFIQLIVALLPLLPPLIQLIVIILPPLISILTVFANILSTVLVAAIAIAIGVISDIITLFGHMVNAVVDVWTWIDNLLEHVKAAFHGMKDAVSDAVGDIVSWFGSLPGKVLGAVGHLGSTLYQSGKDTIQGFLDGAGSLVSTIGDWFLNKLPGWMRDPFKKALGIHSPSTVFASYGQNVVQGLANGISGSQHLIAGAMSDLNDQMKVSSTMSLGMTASGTGTVVDGGSIVPPGAATAGVQPSVVVNLNPSGIIARSRSELRDIAKDMVESINEELRTRRLPQIGGGNITGSSTA